MSDDSIMKMAADKLAEQILALIKEENRSNPNGSFTVERSSQASLRGRPRSRIMIDGTVSFSGELSFSGRAPMTPFPLSEKEFCQKLSEQILTSLGDRLGPDRTKPITYGDVVLINPELRRDFGAGLVTICGSLSIAVSYW